MIPYEDFLKRKVKLAKSTGFDIDMNEINPALKPHNRLMVKWNVEGGQRANFASFGLHKTVTQLETLRIILTRTGGRGLIIAPLGVRQEFINDAKNILGWQVPPKFVRSIDECEETGIYITNYETVRDGKLDPRLFQTASLDEASALRGGGSSKTFREFMRLFTGDGGPLGNRRGKECVPYRFVATATPSPNDYIELLLYADFLGIMDISQAKTRFFKRDSTKADKLTLHAHKEREFWLWVASWALFVQKPSDLTGDPADDEGYILPELDLRWHELPTDHSDAGVEKSGQIRMYKDVALGLTGAAKEKRDSLPDRIAKLLELRADDPDAHRIIWQVDAHGFARSSGDRLLTPAEIAGMEHDKIFKVFKDYSLNNIYDFEYHVAIGDALEASGKLPTTFMLLQPQSWSEEVWTDITRMRTLNSTQYSKGKEMHLCPMQIDLAQRVIRQLSNKGDTVVDPFGGIMTVPSIAVELERYGVAFELNHNYFLDGAAYCKAAEENVTMPTLFDLI